MSGRINTYELSQEADQDLDEIFDYTEAEFGFDRLLHTPINLRNYLIILRLGKKEMKSNRDCEAFPKLNILFFIAF